MISETLQQIETDKKPMRPFSGGINRRDEGEDHDIDFSISREEFIKNDAITTEEDEIV